MHSFDELLYILACPICKGELIPADDLTIFCTTCSIDYQIVGGIPILMAAQTDIFFQAQYEVA